MSVSVVVGFSVYVNFKTRIFPDNNKVKEAYTPVAFISRVELYVCMCLVYVIVYKVGICQCGVVYDMIY
jgi:hypothetical protein